MKLRVKIVTDGTPGGTCVVNAETGEPITFEGSTYQWHILYTPEDGATAKVALALMPDTPVEVVESAKANPFELRTATAKAKAG